MQVTGLLGISGLDELVWMSSMMEGCLCAQVSSRVGMSANCIKFGEGCRKFGELQEVWRGIQAELMYLDFSRYMAMANQLDDRSGFVPRRQWSDSV